MSKKPYQTEQKLNYTTFLTEEGCNKIILDTKNYDVSNKGSTKSIHLNTTCVGGGKYKAVSPPFVSTPFFPIHVDTNDKINSYIAKVEVLPKGFNEYKDEKERLEEKAYEFGIALDRLASHLLKQLDNAEEKEAILSAAGIDNGEQPNMSYNCPLEKHYLYKPLMVFPKIEKDPNNPQQDKKLIGTPDYSKSPLLSLKLWTGDKPPVVKKNKGRTSSSLAASTNASRDNGNNGKFNFGETAENSSSSSSLDLQARNCIVTNDGTYVFVTVTDTRSYENQVQIKNWNEIANLIIYDKNDPNKKYFNILQTCHLVAPSLYICDKQIRFILKVSQINVFGIFPVSNAAEKKVSEKEYQDVVMYAQNNRIISNYLMESNEDDDGQITTKPGTKRKGDEIEDDIDGDPTNTNNNDHDGGESNEKQNKRQKV